MFCSSLPPFLYRRVHVLLMLLVFVCVMLCPIHVVLCFWFVFLRLMLSVSLDCQFLIASAVFSKFVFQHRNSWYCFVLSELR